MLAFQRICVRELLSSIRSFRNPHLRGILPKVKDLTQWLEEGGSHKLLLIFIFSTSAPPAVPHGPLFPSSIVWQKNPPRNFEEWRMLGLCLALHRTVLSAVKNLEEGGGKQRAHSADFRVSHFWPSQKDDDERREAGKGRTQLPVLRQQKPAASLLTFGVPRRGPDKDHPPW